MTHSPLPPFAAYAGSRTPRVLFVGEAFGAEEEQFCSPFIGTAGRFFFQVLGETIKESPELYGEAFRHLHGIGFRKRRDRWAEEVGVGFTNVLAMRPKDNDLGNVTVLKAELPKDYKLPPVVRSPTGRFLAPEFLGELERLEEEVRTSRPSLVVALGNTALWALTGLPNISAKRGVVDMAEGGPLRLGLQKFLPTYHPMAVVHNFPWRPLLKADLIKAWKESRDPLLRRPEREVLIAQSTQDIQSWLTTLLAVPPPLLSCDIETKAGQITCLGFARSRGEALVVPFWNLDPKEPNYWRSSSDEVEAWRLVSILLETEVPKLWQNGMYDLQYLWRMGLRPRAVLHDTMLMHHSMFPELQKGLGFLASIYTSEASWKLMRHAKADVEKSDE